MTSTCRWTWRGGNGGVAVIDWVGMGSLSRFNRSQSNLHLSTEAWKRANESRLLPNGEDGPPACSAGLAACLLASRDVLMVRAQEICIPSPSIIVSLSRRRANLVSLHRLLLLPSHPPSSSALRWCSGVCNISIYFLPLIR